MAFAVLLSKVKFLKEIKFLKINIARAVRLRLRWGQDEE